MKTLYTIMPKRDLNLNELKPEKGSGEIRLNTGYLQQFYETLQLLKQAFAETKSPELVSIIGPSADPSSIYTHATYYAQYYPEHFALLKLALDEHNNAKIVLGVNWNIKKFLEQPKDEDFVLDDSENKNGIMQFIKKIV